MSQHRASGCDPRVRFARCVSAIVRAEVERGGDGHVAQRITARLHEGLWKLFGPAGFDVLLARALVLARKDYRVLNGVAVGPAGTLQGLDHVACEGAVLEDVAVAIVSRFIELLSVLIGEDLTARLVRHVWPRVEVN